MNPNPEDTYALYDEKYHLLARIKAQNQTEAETKAGAWLKTISKKDFGLTDDEIDAAIEDGAFFVQLDDTPNI